MNTLLITPELFSAEGGIARILRLYLKALNEIKAPGSRIGLVTLNDERISAHQLSKYAQPETVGTCGRSKLKFILKTLFQSARYDRILCGHLHQLPIARLAQLLYPSLRYSLIAHGVEVWRPYSAIERNALRHADSIFCVSSFTRQKMLSLCDLDPHRLMVLANALDPIFSPATHKPVEITQPAATILCVSRLDSRQTYKGVDHLIEALARIREEIPEATLRIVGHGDDTVRLRQIAAAYQVTDAVEFTGAVTDDSLRAHYASCDIFVLPSQLEGFGLVYLEAMAYGKPCIAARSGGAPEVVDEISGALVDYGNCDELAKACTKMLKTRPSAILVGNRARLFQYDNFKLNLQAALQDGKN